MVNFLSTLGRIRTCDLLNRRSARPTFRHAPRVSGRLIHVPWAGLFLVLNRPTFTTI